MISIIIPVYNEEKYIGKCLNSIKKQNCENYEIIVVDNNSTDNTIKIAKKYTKKVFLCKKQGISAARNYGAKKAKGEVLCFIDADGIVSEKWINYVENTFLKKVDAVSGMNIFRTNSNIKFVLFNIYNIIVFSFLCVFNKIGRYTLAGNNMAIKKKIFYKVKGFPNYVAEDIKLSKNLRKIKGLKIKFNPKMKIYYSSRRFEKKGFFKTLIYWINSTSKNIDESKYKEEFT